MALKKTYEPAGHIGRVAKVHYFFATLHFSIKHNSEINRNTCM